MQVTAMNVAILQAMESAESVERMPVQKMAHVPRFIKTVFAWYATPKLKKSAFVLADVCNKLKVCALAVQRNGEESLLDSDMAQRDSLQRMKESIRKDREGLRKSFSEIDPIGSAMPVLAREVGIVVSLMDELYEVATELQWALAEHDATYSRRLDGFVADSKVALEAMLQRISAGA